MAERMRQANVDGGRPCRREVKLTAREDGALVDAATDRELTVPAFLVEAGLNAVGQVSDKQRREAASALLRVEYQLARIGNNLNQIARQVNTDGSLSDDLDGTLALVRQEMERLALVAESFVERVGR